MAGAVLSVLVYHALCVPVAAAPQVLTAGRPVTMMAAGFPLARVAHVARAVPSSPRITHIVRDADRQLVESCARCKQLEVLIIAHLGGRYGP